MNRIPPPTISRQGGFLKFTKPLGQGNRVGGGVRGRVKPYISNPSRLRLMRWFAALDLEACSALSIPLNFVTLTTTPEYWDKGVEVYAALERFRDRLEYMTGCELSYTDSAGVVQHQENPFSGYIGAFVRKERGQKRGMLHYHLVVVGCCNLKTAESWVKRAWSESLRSTTPLRVEVQKAEDPAKVLRYLSKYCAKVGYEGAEFSDGGTRAARHAEDPAGNSLSEAHSSGKRKNGNRHWYIWGRKHLPFNELEEEIGEGDAARLMADNIRRAFRNIMRARIRVLGDRLGREKRRLMKAFVRRLRYRNGFSMFYTPSELQRLLDWSAMMVIDST